LWAFWEAGRRVATGRRSLQTCCGQGPAPRQGASPYTRGATRAIGDMGASCFEMGLGIDVREGAVEARPPRLSNLFSEGGGGLMRAPIPPPPKGCERLFFCAPSGPRPAPPPRVANAGPLRVRPNAEGTSALHVMMRDQYANYVVQKIIDMADDGAWGRRMGGGRERDSRVGGGMWGLGRRGVVLKPIE